MVDIKKTLGRSYKATASANTEAPKSRLIQFNHPSKHLDNSISTSKYSLASFFPKFMLEQFSKYANMFFLFISILQQIPNISPTSRYTTIGPLIFILCVAAFKEAIEDSKRHKSDNEVNHRKVQVLVGNEFVFKQWIECQVGDIVKVENSNYFPADIIVLSTSEPDGLCYVETSNLDGETNLKIKQCRPETVTWMNPAQLKEIDGYIESELPNNSLYTFDGTLRYKLNKELEGGQINEHGILTPDGHNNPRIATLNRSKPSNNRDGHMECPLGPEQMLLRGCQLRNTKWIQGMIIFTGHETKLMRNATSAPIKRTDVEKKTNRQIVFLFILMIFMSLFCSIGLLITISSNNQSDNTDDRWYLQDPANLIKNDPSNYALEFIKNFTTFLILFNSLIPISLMVTMEIVKAVTAYLINSDNDMYYPPIKSHAICRTSSLVEELGQIKYIFSDKTGTLTCNIMEFRQACIAGKCYSDRPQKDGNLPIHDFDQLKLDSKSNDKHGQIVHEFLLLLSACHTVIPEMPDGTELNIQDPNSLNQIIYQASSPDESALVKGARLLDYIFMNRKPHSIQILVKNELKEYQILQVNEFNSTRKRMSVIVRNPDGKLVVYCKGADTVILERLSNQNPFIEITNQALSEYANEGLRTLCLASREIPQQEYTEWSKLYEKASTTLVNRQEELDKCAELIETNLFLLGCTAIEDKLQDGVPDTIYNLIQAGIRIWVLTGDRLETAINIGFSCKLLNGDMDLMQCDVDTKEEFKSFLDTQLTKVKSSRNLPVFPSEITPSKFSFFTGNPYKSDDLDTSKSPLALVVTGKALKYALESEFELDFLRLACLCQSVICCRVSPLQKALVVKLVKKHLKTLTLAIGDGANDVGMIQAAHVGIGINGLEGTQAARASDVAIAQFRYLQKLLLVHGTWAYNRISKLILYCFYKNIALQFTQLWFAFQNGFTGQTIYESWSLAAYNLFFTAFQPLYIGIFEQFIHSNNLLKYPQLYHYGQHQHFFNSKSFWGIALNGIYHSLICYFAVFYLMGFNYHDNSQHIQGGKKDNVNSNLK
eukprot:NODE_509_length_6670_cov_0.463856.p1 type:complete len:1053 gc:universal NODE_509_length_6670_cov_0.463856:3825-667(-)